MRATQTGSVSPPETARTRLVLVEGVAGTGKTTAAGVAHRVLTAAGVPARLVLEGDVDHPADHEQVALLGRSAWEGLLNRHGLGDSADDLEPFLEAVPAMVLDGVDNSGIDHSGVNNSGVDRREEQVLVAYGRLRRDRPDLAPDALLDTLQQHDVYEQPENLWRALALHRWAEFARAAERSDVAWVLDCTFLQNPLTVLLARHDASPDVVRAHVTAAAELLRPLAPLVLHLHAGDERAAVERVRPERPLTWWEHFVGYHVGQAWGSARGVGGVEGTVELLRQRTAVEHDLLQRLPVTARCIDTSGDRAVAEAAIADAVLSALRGAAAP